MNTIREADLMASIPVTKWCFIIYGILRQTTRNSWRPTPHLVEVDARWTECGYNVKKKEKKKTLLRFHVLNTRRRPKHICACSEAAFLLRSAKSKRFSLVCHAVPKEDLKSYLAVPRFDRRPAGSVAAVSCFSSSNFQADFQELHISIFFHSRLT